MRARNIKPALFKNELLGKADPIYTLMFEGLWCMADRAGRLQDRPDKIKAEVFPYRYTLDIEPLLSWLVEHKFVDRYATKRGSVIAVTEFLKHQKPHKNEPDSELLPKKHRVRGSKTSTIGGRASTNVRRARADSGLLIADSGSLDTGYRIADSGSRIADPPPQPASVRPIQVAKTVLKNGSSEKPMEAGPRSRDEARPASEIAMAALRTRGLA